MERYYSYSRFIKEYFGKKLYKICIDGGFTCPNRDGTLATGGCIFCSEGGSGEFTENASSLFPNRFILVSHRLPENIRANITLLTFRHLQYLCLCRQASRPLRGGDHCPRNRCFIHWHRPDCITPEILVY